MKRFILFLTTFILLPIALQAQATDTIENNSGFIIDSVKLEKGVLTRYGRYNGEYCIEVIKSKNFRKENKKEEPQEADEIKSEEPRPDLDLEYCTYKGIPLKGCVKIVESNADFRVRFVPYESAADIVVETATGTSRTDPCCTWKFVSSNADFIIKIDNSFPDLNVYVNDSNIDYYEKYKDY